VETDKLEVDNVLKAGLTIIGIITAAGTKFPLFLMAKGLTRRSHKQFGDGADQSDVYITHSRSGWVIRPVFSECPADLRWQIPDGPRCLIVYQYQTGVTPECEDEDARLESGLSKV
jgi:hypothetical protein